MFTMQAQIVTLHWEDQLESSNDQMSSNELKCSDLLRIEANQVHILIAKEHSKRRWKEVSEQEWQEEHIEGK